MVSCSNQRTTATETSTGEEGSYTLRQTDRNNQVALSCFADQSSCVSGLLRNAPNTWLKCSVILKRNHLCFLSLQIYLHEYICSSLRSNTSECPQLMQAIRVCLIQFTQEVNTDKQKLNAIYQATAWKDTHCQLIAKYPCT